MSQPANAHRSPRRITVPAGSRILIQRDHVALIIRDGQTKEAYAPGTWDSIHVEEPAASHTEPDAGCEACEHGRYVHTVDSGTGGLFVGPCRVWNCGCSGYLRRS